MVTLEITLGAADAEALAWPAGHVVYLVWYDIDALGGLGACRLTDNIAEAMTWPSRDAAMQSYVEQSTESPYRSDGFPNRPLTKYTITIVEVP